VFYERKEERVRERERERRAQGERGGRGGRLSPHFRRRKLSPKKKKFM